MRTLHESELHDVGGAGLFSTFVKIVEAVGIAEAIADFGQGFVDGYNSTQNP